MKLKQSVRRSCISAFVTIMTLQSFGFCGLGPMSPPLEGQVMEKAIRAELLMSIGSDKENEDFFKPAYFTVDPEGHIYVLDSGNSRIQCFSGEGRFLFSFGRLGQGPGELSKDASRIRLLEDGNLYVIDDSQRRITAYSRSGKYQKSWVLTSVYDDICLKNQTYYLSNLFLKNEHHPVHSSRDLSQIDTSFGDFIEPTPGIQKAITTSPFLQMLERQFAFPIFPNFTHLFVNSKEEITYSQSNPYHLVKYGKDGRKTGEAIARVDFDTYFPLKIEFGKDSVTYHLASSPARAYEPISLDDDTLFVPVMCPDRSFVFLDIYDSGLRQLSRYRLANIFFDAKKKEGVTNFYIDQKRNLYCLVVSQETYPRLSKYKLLFD
jgi:hypothetical protein